MNKSHFKKIKAKYGKCASFAVWDDEDLTKLDVIEENVEQLRTDIVFVGLNPNGGVRTFGNFHGREDGAPGQGNNDSRLMKTFNKSKFRGAYMTDLFKDNREVNQNQLKITEKIKKKAFAAFNEELKLIGAKNPKIIAFGDKVYCYLLEWKEKSKFKCTIHKLPHYSIWNPNKFYKEVKKLLKI